MNLKRAPVLITVYDRYDHLRQTIEALSRNVLADETIVYIASDAPQDEASAPKIKKVRDYIATIRGFKAVVPLLRDENVGGFENSQMGWQEVWSEHDRAIRMEDDIVTGRGFLKFMNDGLDLYASDSKVHYVCGYMYPGVQVQSGAVLLPFMNAWGVATWRDKTPQLNSENRDDKRLATESLRDAKFFHKLNVDLPHIPPMLLSMASGRLVAGDVYRTVTMKREATLALHPSETLVKNIGFDGTGLHCGFDHSFRERRVCEDIIRINPDRVSAYEPTVERQVARYFGGWKKAMKNLPNYYLWRLTPFLYEQFRYLKAFLRGRLKTAFPCRFGIRSGLLRRDYEPR